MCRADEDEYVRLAKAMQETNTYVAANDSGWRLPDALWDSFFQSPSRVFPVRSFDFRGGMMISESEFQSLVSREVVDRNGKSVGYIETVFKDRDTGRSEWLGVMTGTWRHHHRLVPATDDVRMVKTSVTIPWTKEQVESAPDYGKPDRPVSKDLEDKAYRHYGKEPAAT